MDIRSIKNIRKPPVCKAPPPKSPTGPPYAYQPINVVRAFTGYQLNYTVTYTNQGSVLPRPTLSIIGPNFIDSFVAAGDGQVHAYERQPMPQFAGQVWLTWISVLGISSPVFRFVTVN